MNLGAAEEHHRDQRRGRVKAERAPLEDVDLGVDALEATVGDGEADGGEDAVAVVAQRLGEPREGTELGATGPREPPLEVRRGAAGRAAIERTQLLLEEVRAVHAAVELLNLDKTTEVLQVGILGRAQEGPARVLQHRRRRESLECPGLVAPDLMHGLVGELDDVEGIERDLGLRSARANLGDVGRAHVHGDDLQLGGALGAELIEELADGVA